VAFARQAAHQQQHTICKLRKLRVHSDDPDSIDAATSDVEIPIRRRNHINGRHL
jgi:hypothetical protein